MGGLRIKRRIGVYVALILIAVGCLCCILLYEYTRTVDNTVDNKARLLMSDVLYEVSQGNFETLANYPYCIIDLEGIVIDSNQKEYPPQSRIDMTTLTNSSFGSGPTKNYIYSTPLIQKDVQIGTIYVQLPYSKLVEKSYTVLVLAVGIVLIILLLLYSLVKFLYVDVLRPIKQIHTTTLKLLEGDMSERIPYDYDGEVGTLCHDFEALREELEYSVQNEKKLKEKEKLLLAYISHDLRTPIATITGYVEGIHAGIVKGDKVKEYTSIILKKITMLNGLIEDILEHSKSQLHEFTIHKTECYAREFFCEVLKEVEADVLKNGLLFSYNEVPNILINIDKKRIRQVIQNLVGNAIKFTKEGSITITFTYDQERLYVAVKDTGIGIAAIDQPQIFEEFFRGERARTLNVPGTGLGLSIAKYIITQHDGKIECESLLDHGTTIEFYIPVA